MSSRPLRIEPATISWGALAVALIGAGALVYHLTRTTTLWFDEWTWALERRGGGLDSLLRPHNGHFSLVPITIYKFLFATAGISSSMPYRIVMIVCELGCALLFYAYARRRVGDFLSLLATGVILSLGPAWQDILWPFQIAWLISIAAGIAALLALDRRDRRGDLAACVLLAVSLASSSVGVAIALGAVVELAWARRSWRDAWIALAPLLLYALWSIAYQHVSLSTDVPSVARFVAKSFTGSLSALFGLSGTTSVDPTVTTPRLGWLLALGALVLLLWRSYRHGAWPPRAVTVAAMLAAFWILTAFGRTGFVSPDSSRYLYVGCVFALLVAIELARGLRVTRPLGVAIAVIAVAAAISNLGTLREGAAYLRNSALLAKADLGALEIGRQIIPASYTATSFPDYPFVVVKSDAYFAMAHAIGTPAFTLAQLAAAPEGAREIADRELARIDAIAPRYGSSSRSSGPPPVVEQSSGGTVLKRGPCVALKPLARPTDAAPTVARLELTLAPGGAGISLSGPQALVEARRFARAFQPVGSLRARSSVTIRASPDRASTPWHLEIVTGGPVTVCS